MTEKETLEAIFNQVSDLKAQAAKQASETEDNALYLVFAAKEEVFKLLLHTAYASIDALNDIEKQIQKYHSCNQE